MRLKGADARIKHEAKDLGLQLLARSRAVRRAWGLFYATYAAVTGLFVAIDLQVEPASHYKTFFVIFDVLQVFYLCLVNQWSRNKIIASVDRLSKRESR